MGRDRSLDVVWRFERTYEAYLRKVRRAVATELEVAVDEVVLLRSGTFLKTTSG